MLSAPLVFVSSDVALQQLVKSLQKETLIGVDTESNSLFAYRERVCLIQISTRTADYAIDPFAVTDLSPLGIIFADPKIEKVFHAAEYDLIGLKRDYDFTFANLFDTVIAARVLGYKSFGLANMLEANFGVQHDKKYQRADWSTRPIPAGQLAYAQYDTHYLPELRDILLKELSDKGCLEEATELFTALLDTPPGNRVFDPEGYWSIHAARDLPRRQMAFLKELYELREEIASDRDLPPFKIMSDEVLVTLAQVEPESFDALWSIRGLGRTAVERYGIEIIRAIDRGRHARPPRRPDRGPRMDDDVMTRYDALRAWRKNRAAERGVESDIIISKDVLLALAENPPRTLEDLQNVPGLGPWRRSTYGAELIALLNRDGASDAGE